MTRTHWSKIIKYMCKTNTTYGRILLRWTFNLLFFANETYLFKISYDIWIIIFHSERMTSKNMDQSLISKRKQFESPSQKKKEIIKSFDQQAYLKKVT